MKHATKNYIGPGVTRKRQTPPLCPECSIQCRRVNIKPKHGPHFHCPGCGVVRGLVEGALITTEAARLVMQTGVDEKGNVVRPTQKPLFDSDTPENKGA